MVLISKMFASKSNFDLIRHLDQHGIVHVLHELFHLLRGGNDSHIIHVVRQKPTVRGATGGPPEVLASANLLVEPSPPGTGRLSAVQKSSHPPNVSLRSTPPGSPLLRGFIRQPPPTGHADMRSRHPTATHETTTCARSGAVDGAIRRMLVLQVGASLSEFSSVSCNLGYSRRPRDKFALLANLDHAALLRLD